MRQTTLSKLERKGDATRRIQPHTTPLPHQIEALQRIEEVGGRSLLALDMRLGKSGLALYFAAANPEERMPVVVVCPLSVKWNWQKEASARIGVRSRILEGTIPYDGTRVYQKERVWIVNYDILTEWIPFLRKLKPRTIIIDESQYIKNHRAKRTRSVRRLCKGVPNLLGLSGTPLTNRPVELFPILNLLWPKEFPKFLPFAARYCNLKQTPFGPDFSGAKNLPELHDRLTKLGMIRMRYRDVMKDAPPKNQKIVLIDIEDPEGQYEKAREGYIHWLRDFRHIVASKMQERSQLNGIKTLVGRLKLPSVFRWLDAFLAKCDHKIIVFGWHREVVEGIHERYKRISVMVHGGIRGKNRQAMFDRFSKSNQIRILSGNIQAAGTGWPGHAARAVAVVEFPWTPGDLAQATARPEGPLQKHKVDCYYLTARNTIDETLIRTLRKKQEILAATLDGKKRQEDFDVYDKVAEALKKERV